jgi:hypothetical protein
MIHNEQSIGHNISALFVSLFQPYYATYSSPKEVDLYISLFQTAWNLDLIPEEEQNEYLKDLGCDDISETIKKITHEKNELFPYMTIGLDEVEHVHNESGDFIRVVYDGREDKAPISPMLFNAKEHMPNTLNELQALVTETDELLYKLETKTFKSKDTTDLINDVIYSACLNRGNIRWYRLLLVTWKLQQPAKRVKDIAKHWLETIQEVDGELQKVLQLIEELAHMTGYSTEGIDPPLSDKQIQYAKEIDDHVNKMIKEGVTEQASDGLILTTMYDYSERFKYIQDTVDSNQQDTLSERFPGYYRYGKLMEMLAQGISDGVLEVPKDH